MDLCVFDLAIFSNFVSAGATVFAGGAAIWIFFQWRGQKGSEVVANEARQSIKNILEMTKIVSSIRPGEYFGSLNQSQLERLNILFEMTISDILYLDDCIVVDGLKIEINEFAEIANKVRKKSSSDLLAIGLFGKHAINLVNILRPYSIYAVKFRFKGSTEQA